MQGRILRMYSEKIRRHPCCIHRNHKKRRGAKPLRFFDFFETTLFVQKDVGAKAIIAL